MPAVLDLELAIPADTQVYPARLHGAACTMLEDDSVPHTAQHKPFSVGPLIEENAGRTRWRVGWLGSAEPPPIPETITLGPARCPVRPARPTLISFAELLAVPPVRHVELRFFSPTFFARKGRDLPLPDPVLIMRSLATRWDAHAPPELALPAEVLTALLDTVYLADAVIETRRAQVSRTMWQTGFVGAARLALTKAGDAATTQVFTALTRFAEFAGIGAQTTHGFGAVRLATPRHKTVKSMGLQFARTFTQQALLDAWQEVRDAALADGRLDPELEQFEADAARRVSHLAVALAEGEWRPLPAHQLEISKPSGGTRRLTIPPLADRVVERALLVTLDREIDPSLLPWSFAYRRGLGTRDALAALTEARDTGATWVARADIRDCFDRIPRWEVMRLVRERIDDERIVHLVGLILNRPVVNHRSAPADRGRGLHQGSVLAPLLSNLYLDIFDRRMLAAGPRVIRYADDFAIPRREPAIR